MKLFGGSGEHNGRSDRQTKKRPAAAQSGAKAQTAPKPQGKKGGRTAAPKKHSKKRIAAIVIAVLIALLCACGAAYYVFFVRPPTDTIHDKTNGDKVDTSSLLNQGTRIKDVFTFVVGAVDEDQTRTDALMVATMNTKDKTINIMNVPRDTMCNNGESGAWRKINAAYATKKGIEQTKVEIERLMGFQPDRYVIVNFDGIAAIVDAIGGVDIDVQNDNELKELNRVIKDYGADIIRLWVASSDYTVDVRAGKNIFKQLSEAYRKIRNTARFILGNLDGFDPNTDCVADDQLQEIDRWALAALDDLMVNTSAGYAVYDFNKVYHAVYNFCVVAMSNFYLDVTKDRLYCTNGAGRKAAQTTMYKILVALDKIIAPILCFTSQEIWDFMPKTEGMNQYVVFEEMPKAGQYAADEAFKAKWAQLIAVRDEVKKVLEQARAEKVIGASLEAAVTLYCNDTVYSLLNSIPMDELADLMIVSQVELVKGEGGAASAVEGLGVAAAHATGEKCERCWKYSSSIGSHAAHPTLCARCASVVEA